MIFVTGGTGLLGAQLLLDLTASGQTVTALHRPTADFSFFDFLFKGQKMLRENILWVAGDLNDVDSLNRLIERDAEVYHCAGLVSFDSRDSEKLYLINIEGTANLVNCCLDKQIRKLVHVSSVGTLGRTGNATLTINEDSHWQSSNEVSDYAISKYGAEREVWRGIAEGLNAVIINPSVIIGAGRWDTGSSKMISQVWKGLLFYSGGVSGFVDVKDVSSIMIQLMNGEISGERFIVSSENIAYKTFFEIAATALHKKPPTVLAAPWMGGLAWRLEAFANLFFHHQPLITKYTAITAQRKYNYDASKIQQALKYKFIPVAESIKRVCGEFIESR